VVDLWFTRLSKSKRTMGHYPIKNMRWRERLSASGKSVSSQSPNPLRISPIVSILDPLKKGKYFVTHDQ
jgi:hypothetical protein